MTLALFSCWMMRFHSSVVYFPNDVFILLERFQNRREPSEPKLRVPLVRKSNSFDGACFSVFIYRQQISFYIFFLMTEKLEILLTFFIVFLLSLPFGLIFSNLPSFYEGSEILATIIMAQGQRSPVIVNDFLFTFGNCFPLCSRGFFFFLQDFSARRGGYFTPPLFI